MVSNHFKQIAISHENYETLKKMGKMRDTFDDVVTKLLKDRKV